MCIRDRHEVVERHAAPFELRACCLRDATTTRVAIAAHGERERLVVKRGRQSASPGCRHGLALAVAGQRAKLALDLVRRQPAAARPSGKLPDCRTDRIERQPSAAASLVDLIQ